MGTGIRGRRGLLRLVRPRPRVPLDGEAVVRVPLPDGIVGRWLRYRGRDEVQISQEVPAVLTQLAAQHLLAHGSTGMADALGLLSCDVASCDSAPYWIGCRYPAAAASDS